MSNALEIDISWTWILMTVSYLFLAPVSSKPDYCSLCYLIKGFHVLNDADWLTVKNVL